MQYRYCLAAPFSRQLRINYNYILKNRILAPLSTWRLERPLLLLYPRAAPLALPQGRHLREYNEL
jgi:hypothetical protein